MTNMFGRNTLKFLIFCMDILIKEASGTTTFGWVYPEKLKYNYTYLHLEEVPLSSPEGIARLKIIENQLIN